MLPVQKSTRQVPLITLPDLAGRVTWTSVAEAIAEGHRRDQPKLGDVLLEEDGNSWLTRAARIRGLGMLTKTASVYPDNPIAGRPSIQGAAILFDDETGTVDAFIDNDALTRVKTAADSLLGARLLARPGASRLLIIGAGVVAGDLVRAYSDGFTLDRVQLWNRSRPRAEALRDELARESLLVELVDDLERAVAEADLVATATMSRDPLVLGAWVNPGTHVDLVGAYTPAMRESDDALITRSQVFVDCRVTTESQVGDLAIPIANGVFSADRIKGSLYPLATGKARREGEDAVTVFKNGGGGHIDLMVARHLAERVLGPGGKH
ncbi:ornithine cyclodeaminase [Roseovarius sp.]|uniref:ornithine cyclodeaminase family protein n=1 Tax=Roseovarius sp. TaxID=1486281 RepID=UPI000C3EF102|nr:ornithine cyclodeaminase [Roseovarius sp.]MAZ21037.1 ornithine cyclodeaminase [Roseovarius sp.]